MKIIIIFVYSKIHKFSSVCENIPTTNDNPMMHINQKKYLFRENFQQKKNKNYTDRKKGPTQKVFFPFFSECKLIFFSHHHHHYIQIRCDDDFCLCVFFACVKIDNFSDDDDDDKTSL